MEGELKTRVQSLINDWILDIADEYNNATPRVKARLEKEPASQEEWDTLLNQIHQEYKDAGYLRSIDVSIPAMTDYKKPITREES